MNDYIRRDKIGAGSTPLAQAFLQSALFPAAFAFRHLARAIWASRALAAALMRLRVECLEFPRAFSLAQRALWAAAILARPAALMPLLPPPWRAGSVPLRSADNSDSRASILSCKAAARRNSCEVMFMRVSLYEIKSVGTSETFHTYVIVNP